MSMFGPWDLALIVAVTLLSLVPAYVRHPAHKTVGMMLPIPFTLAVLAVGEPVNASNVLGVCVMFLFKMMVWALHAKARAPILFAIGVAMLTYGAVSTLLHGPWLQSEVVFWAAVAMVLSLAALGAVALPARTEPASRTPLPVWIKLPAIALVVTMLVLAKDHLGGFVTTFPFVGSVTAYEARRSLWMNVRRIPWLALAVVPMMAAIHLTQGALGLGGALAVGWIVLLSCFVLMRRYDADSPLHAVWPATAQPR